MSTINTINLENTLESDQSIQIKIIKESYQLGINYYNQNNFILAEKEFVKVLRPVLSKFKILEPHNIVHVKNEVSNSMYHLGLIYRISNIYPNNYAKATAIFHYCAKFSKCYDIEKLTSEYFLKEAYKMEKEFLESIQIYSKSYSNKCEQYKNKLLTFRKQIKQKLEELDNDKDIILHTNKVELLYEEINKFFINDDGKGFIQQLFIDCIEELGELPQGLQYTIIALGSFAQGTATPWSDLEFAVLINQNNEEYKQYFRNLTQLFYIKVVNLGETHLRWVGVESLNNFKTGDENDDWFWDDIAPYSYGFCLDGAHWHACETPLGRKDYKIKIDTKIVNKPDFELIMTPDDMITFQQNSIIMTSDDMKQIQQDSAIMTPDDMIKFQQNSIIMDNQTWNDSDPHLVQSLKSVAWIYGDKKLLDDYKFKLKNALSIDIIRLRSIKLLLEDVNLYQLKLDNKREIINVKKDIYRLIDRIIVGLANYYNITAESGEKLLTMWNILDRMKTIISEEGIQYFKEALSIANELRLRTYLNNVNNPNKELMRIHKNHQENIFYYDKISMIARFYQIMIQVQNLVKEFCIHQDSSILKNNKFYIDDNYTISLINSTLNIT